MDSICKIKIIFVFTLLNINYLNKLEGMSAEAVRRRNVKEKTANPKIAKPKKEKETPGSINTFIAVMCAVILSGGLIRVLIMKPDTLTSPSYLPLVDPDCCTGSEDHLTRLWGSYRPQVYFGIRPRIPQSVIFGLMWMPISPGAERNEFRHTSEQNELQSFIWTAHDGNKFGVQHLQDRGYYLETSFVKTNYLLQDWSAKVKVEANGNGRSPTAISLFWYLGVEHNQSKVRISTLPNGFSVYGETPELGKFHLRYKTVSPVSKIMHTAMICGNEVPLHLLSDYVKESLKTFRNGNIKFAGLQTSDIPCGEDSNAVVMQLSLPLGAEVEVIYENLNIDRTASVTLEGINYDKLLKTYKEDFDKKFEDKFNLKSKGFDEEHISFAKSTFSNLIGGIGYFYGKSIVTSSEVEESMYYWSAALYSAVPSRAFFPRGFLWDEGFHQLLISKWDTTISMEVIGHWLNLMNADGWIPREQILGNEARMKVPKEFVVQNADYANPPTLFLALDSMYNSMQPSEILDHHSSLKKMFHRLTLWFNWYNTTQVGPLPTTYRWRGRNGTTDTELNPKTLTSGLDDYPRASHPSQDEYHVDLRCWIAFASRSLQSLGDLIGMNVDKYKETADVLFDNDKLKELHWTGDYFADYGLHSDKVGLADKHVANGQPMQKRRVVRKIPQNQFVKVQGYINLFPFILNILEPSSPELGHILNHVKSPNGIWSKYGLCSVSKSDFYYLKYNTEHDAPYWRGPIWININFLTIRALDHYSKVPGPFQSLCTDLYSELRTNIVENMFKEFKRTGYIWEQYNCQTGKGQSVHPFTGWSSLVVLIMGEQY